MHLLGQMLHLDNSELWCFAGEPPTYIQGKELQAPQCPKTWYNVNTPFHQGFADSYETASSILVQPTCEIVAQPPSRPLPGHQRASRSNQAPLPGRVGLDGGFRSDKNYSKMGRSQWAPLPDIRNMSSFGCFGVEEWTDKLSLSFWQDHLTDIGFIG